MDLTPFCSTDESRKSLHAPWSDGEHSFASNGKLLIRIKLIPEIPERKDAPRNINNLFQPSINIDCSTLLPADFQHVTEYAACDICKGTGQCTCRCCDAVHPCGICKGEGTLRAETTISGFRFQVKQLHLLQSLPNSKWILFDHRIYFIFDYGDGFIASIT